MKEGCLHYHLCCIDSSFLQQTLQLVLSIVLCVANVVHSKCLTFTYCFIQKVVCDVVAVNLELLPYVMLFTNLNEIHWLQKVSQSFGSDTDDNIVFYRKRKRGGTILSSSQSEELVCVLLLCFVAMQNTFVI